jgi:hypothetical protein
MRTPEDEVVLAMWQGRGSWSGSTVDATELAAYVEEADQRTVPQTPDAIDRILTDLHEAGLVTSGSRPLNMARGIQMYRPYVLAEKGLARAHELEAVDEHFPPHGDES